MNKDILKKRYDNACNAYLKAFCEKHKCDYEDAKDSWVANDVGSICMLGDSFVSLSDMMTDINNDAPKEEYWRYYTYLMDSQELGFNCPNYASWLRGCPRMSEEQQTAIREAKNRVCEAQKEFERILKEENKKVAGGF